MNAFTDQADPDRTLVLIKWDGRSRPIYAYQDELSLPDFRRTHFLRREDVDGG